MAIAPIKEFGDIARIELPCKELKEPVDAPGERDV